VNLWYVVIDYYVLWVAKPIKASRSYWADNLVMNKSQREGLAYQRRECTRSETLRSLLCDAADHTAATTHHGRITPYGAEADCKSAGGIVSLGSIPGPSTILLVS